MIEIKSAAGGLAGVVDDGNFIGQVVETKTGHWLSIKPGECDDRVRVHDLRRDAIGELSGKVTI